MNEFKVGDWVRRTGYTSLQSDVASYRGEPFRIGSIDAGLAVPEGRPENEGHFLGCIDHCEPPEPLSAEVQLKFIPPEHPPLALVDAAPALGKQVGFLLVYLKQAIEDAREAFNDPHFVEDMLEMMGSRFVDGFVEYGDNLFKLTEGEAHDEGMQEAADLVVYFMRRAQARREREALEPQDPSICIGPDCFVVNCQSCD